MKHFGILAALLAISISAYAQAKYVFYFIGDGIGTNQILGAEMYRSALQGEPLGRIQTYMTQVLPVHVWLRVSRLVMVLSA